jgi:hypothetical protein
MILEFNKFNLMTQISNELSAYFPHIKVTKNFLWASTELDKLNNPQVSLVSKNSILGLLLKFHEDAIEIKSIVNSTNQKGIATKVVEVILQNLKDGDTIIVDNDVSSGYWSHITKKYPNFNWIFS